MHFHLLYRYLFISLLVYTVCDVIVCQTITSHTVYTNKDNNNYPKQFGVNCIPAFLHRVAHFPDPRIDSSIIHIIYSLYNIDVSLSQFPRNLHPVDDYINKKVIAVIFSFAMEPWHLGDGDTALWVVNKLQMFTSYAGLCIFPLLGCVTIISQSVVTWS